MNTRKLLVSILILICVLLSACAPAVTATQGPTQPASTPVPVATAVVNDFTLAGDPIPDKLLNVDYYLVAGNPPNVLRLYAPDDPICLPLKIEGNCFTILRPDRPSDPGARGPATLVDGLVALKFQLVPFGPDDIGSTEYFESQEDGGIMVGVKCETKTGAACNADVGSTWKSAPQQTTWQSPGNASFRLPLTVTYGPEWEAHVGINVINIINKGNPPMPESKWWGPDIILLNGAQVSDPEDMTKLMPLPDDFFAYITSLPGVKVIKGPEPVLLGGLQGNQLIVDQTPFHPIWQLKDDYAMSGHDLPELRQVMILLDVNGEQILLWFPEPRETFDERYPLVQEIFNSITFGK